MIEGSSPFHGTHFNILSRKDPMLNFFKFVLIILSAPIIVLAWAVISDDPSAMDKVKLFFDYFSTLPSWFTNLWILVVASIYGIKGTQIFRNGKK